MKDVLRDKRDFRRGRAASCLAFAILLFSSCNDFSFTGILNSPPPGPPGLKLLPDTVSLTSTGQQQFVASGGSGGYSFSLAAGSVGSIGAGGLYQALGTAGTDTVIVTDSSGTSTESTVMVLATAIPLSISPASTTVNAGGSVAFSGSGGTAPYTWTSTGPGSVSAGGIFSAPWNTAGGSATVRVTDSTSAYREAAVAVNAAAAVQISPATVTLNAHGSVTFAASGGSGSYTYALAGAGSLAGAVYTAPWNSPGTAAVTATDASTGGTATASITIEAPPALTISPSSASIYDTGSVTFAASGGSGTPANYSYSVFAGSGSMAGSTYTPAGTGTATVRVSDSATGQHADALVSVSAAPLVLAIVPPATTVNAGGTVAFSASGGTPPYTFTQAAGGGSLAGTTYTAPWTPGPATIRVTDAALSFADSTVTIGPASPPVITPGATSLAVGQSVTFAGSGGSGSYTYALVSGLGTLAGATYTAPGTPTSATIRLSDTLTGLAVDAVVTVAAPPTLTVTPAASNVLAGSAVSFTGSGGSGSYSWSLAAGSGTLAGSTYTTATAEPSTIRLTDTVTHATADATVVSYFSLTIIPAAISVQVNTTYQFDATGGVPPYAYTVTAGPGSIDSTGLYSAGGAAGPATVQVTDTLANASTAAVTVTPLGVWTIQSVDAASRSGQYASLALDAGGNPQVAYYESRNKELRLEKLVGSTWIRQTVDNTSTAVGQYASLALDGAGNARISYYDAKNNRLKYAAWNGSSWTIQVVDAAGGNIGTYTSLALDAGGNPRISYYDVTGKRLKYASWNGSSWTIQVVDAAGDAGMYSSLALDAAGYPHISYFNNSTGTLMYAAWNGTNWATQVIDASSGTGSYSSLALEPGTGYPHVSYYDSANKVLKHAWWNGSAWAMPQVVDAAVNVGTWTSIAIDAAKNPHISYYDAGNKVLKYVSASAGNAWGVPVTADGASNVGTFTSLRLDTLSGKARIAYYNAAGQDLKYAAEN
jgi:hypothetical protein